MPSQKKIYKLENIVADRDVIFGDQNIIGFSYEEVSKLLGEIRTQIQLKPFSGICPYKGLDFFDEQDANHFFGREQIVLEISTKIDFDQFVFIVGPSGCGKSSLVRAGIIPRMKATEGKNWLFLTVSPGNDPIDRLALAIGKATQSPQYAENLLEKARANPNALHRLLEIIFAGEKNCRAVLFVDQFEELFNLARKERETFLELIFCALAQEQRLLRVIFTMRSDFVIHCAAIPKLNALLNKYFFQVGQMQNDELVRAIDLPALDVGLEIEPGLVSQIIYDMNNEPGSLPLMQFALKELFEKLQSSGSLVKLTRAEYIKRGGIHKALERHATAKFMELSKHDQLVAEKIFVNLVHVRSGSQDTRRIARFDEFVHHGQNDSDLNNVVQKMADARLIITDENETTGRTLTLAHEKLIEAWPWLRELVEKNRNIIRFASQVLQDAQEWEANGKNASYLYKGQKLVLARRNLENVANLNEKALEFLQASQVAIRREKIGRLALFAAGGLMSLIILIGVILPLFNPSMRWDEENQLGQSGVAYKSLTSLPDHTIYAGVDNEATGTSSACIVKKPPDSGTWEPVGTSPICQGEMVGALYVDPSRPETIYFTKYSQTGFYRSNDGGDSWEKTGDSLPLQGVTSIQVSPDGKIYVADILSNQGVFESSDEGKTWIPLPPLSDSPPAPIFSMLWMPTGLLVGPQNGGLWLLQPNGDWKQLVREKITFLTLVSIPGETPGLIAAGLGDDLTGAVYFLDEQGVHRQKNTLGITHLAYVARPEPYLLSLTYQGELWQLDLHGEKLEKINTRNSVFASALVVQQDDPLQIWLASDKGLYYGEMVAPAIGIFGRQINAQGNKNGQ